MEILKYLNKSGKILTVLHDPTLTPNLEPVSVVKCIVPVAGCSFENNGFYTSNASREDTNTNNFEYIGKISDFEQLKIINPVQMAFSSYVQACENFRDSNITKLSKVQVESQLKGLNILRKNVWYAVSELTKDINPNLKADIDRGLYDHQFSSSDLCFLQKNWGIYAEGSKCCHCGEVHK